MENATVEEQTTALVNGIFTLDKLYDLYAKSVGLTYIGLHVLTLLYENPDRYTQKMLADTTGLPKQSVNVVIRSLLEQGYVQMKEQGTDRRNKEIRLSKSGRAYAEKIVGKLMNAVTDALGQQTPVQRQAALLLVGQLTKNLEGVIE